LFCQYFNLSDEDCSSRFDEIKNESTKSAANNNQNARGILMLKDNERNIDDISDILPLLLFQLIGKRKNVVSTDVPELYPSTIDPILIELIQQQQQVSQSSSVLFLPSPSQVPVILNCAPSPVSGILNDEPLSCFLNQGFTVIYNFTYSHITTTTEIKDIRNGCGVSNILCMGGFDSTNSNILLVVACGFCLDVLNVTSKDQPQLHNGVYWYNTPFKSIGFAPSSTILQNPADAFDLTNNQ
jgi:hypothetical protein